MNKMSRLQSCTLTVSALCLGVPAYWISMQWFVKKSCRSEDIENGAELISITTALLFCLTSIAVVRDIFC
jgi:hypothetical protein